MPALKLDDQKFEFIFLLDKSGSMRGQPMELAKKALLVSQLYPNLRIKHYRKK